MDVLLCLVPVLKKRGFLVSREAHRGRPQTNAVSFVASVNHMWAHVYLCPWVWPGVCPFCARTDSTEYKAFYCVGLRCGPVQLELPRSSDAGQPKSEVYTVRAPTRAPPPLDSAAVGAILLQTERLNHVSVQYRLRINLDDLHLRDLTHDDGGLVDVKTAEARTPSARSHTLGHPTALWARHLAHCVVEGGVKAQQPTNSCVDPSVAVQPRGEARLEHQGAALDGSDAAPET